MLLKNAMRAYGPRGLAMLLGLLAGCSQPGDDRTADGRLIISYWEKWTGFESDAMQAVVDDFNASQTNLFVQMLSISQIDRKLMLATAGGNPPDLAGIWASNICDFSEKGALTPLDRLAAEAGVRREEYIPVFWNSGCHLGFLWSLPSTPTSVALHWNKKMFREAGLDPERPPRSLEELDAMAERLTVVELVRTGKVMRVRYPELTPAEKAAKEFKLIEVGHLPGEPGWWMGLWCYWFGGQPWNGTNQITATSPELVRTFEWIRSYSEKYGVDNIRSFGASFGNFASPQNPFLGGQVAMELQGIWMYNFIDKYAPQLEWGAAPFPALDPARFPLVTLADADVLVIPRGSRHVREAFAFIRYVSRRDALEKLALGQRKFSPLLDTSAEFIARHPNPRIRQFIDLARSPFAMTFPRTSIWTEYSQELLVAVDRVAALEATPEAALAAVQDRIQRRMDRLTRRWELVRGERLKEWRDYDPR